MPWMGRPERNLAESRKRGAKHMLDTLSRKGPDVYLRRVDIRAQVALEDEERRRSRIGRRV